MSSLCCRAQFVLSGDFLSWIILHIQYSKGFMWVIYFNINVFQWLIPYSKGKELYHLFRPKVLALLFVMVLYLHISLLTLWSMELIFIIFKNSVYTFHKTHCISITKTSWLMLLWEIISLFWYSYKNHKYALQEKCKGFKF